jgi:nucleotide-binding universal stress UspA family protein
MAAYPERIDAILCPTDFSPFSERAMRHAVAVASRSGARLKVTHVLPGLAAFAGAAPLPDAVAALIPESRRYAESQLRSFVQPAVLANVTVETEVRDGEPWRELRSVAEELPADLVVMGTHGRSAFERLVLGSVTEKLLRLLPCPVLSVCHEEGRTWESPGLVRRLLYATDLSDFSLDALGFALRLAPGERIEVMLLHVVEQLSGVADSLQIPGVGALGPELERAAGARLEELARAADERFDVAVTGRLARGRAWREILRTAAVERADVIAIGPGHGAFEQLLFGSDAHHVVREATCPVLTLRPLGKRRDRAGENLSMQLREHEVSSSG